MNCGTMGRRFKKVVALVEEKSICFIQNIKKERVTKNSKDEAL